MKIGDWAGLVNTLPPETPVLFYRGELPPLTADGYCEGEAVESSSYWDGGEWHSCVLVELGAVV